MKLGHGSTFLVQKSKCLDSENLKFNLLLYYLFWLL